MRRTPGQATGAPGTQTAPSEEQGERVAQWPIVDPDPATRAAALAVVARLSLPKARHATHPRRGSGRLETAPFAGGSADIDLDRTLERLVAHEVRRSEDVLVRERMQRRRAVVLIVDLSGSMRGERVKTAAGAVAGVAAELSADELAVVAFWSDAAVLLPLGAPIRPSALVETLLRIPAEGLTNVSLPLEVAAEQLRRSRAQDRRVVLLSDCVHNAGPDPRLMAHTLPRLDVLFDDTGESDLELATDLAHAGRGRLVRIRGYRDLPRGLRAIFAR
jgi:Mg-chelatase subunit ChlD